MGVTLETAARNAAVDGVVDLLDAGNIQFQTSAHGEVAECALNATAFGAASSGTATANAISDDTNTTAGTIAHAHIRTSADASLIIATCGIAASGEPFILSNLTFGNGDTLEVDSLTITQPAS